MNNQTWSLRSMMLKEEQKKGFKKLFSPYIVAGISVILTISGCQDSEVSKSAITNETVTDSGQKPVVLNPANLITEDESRTSIESEGKATAKRWPPLKKIPLNLEIEARIDDVMGKMTLEQKVGQVIQADSTSITPEEVKQYRLGSVLSGGNSAPGPEPYADVKSWVEAVDAAYMASIDSDGVEVAIPIIWGIDAVHGHNNVIGGVIFPHNIGLGAANNPDLIQKIAEVTAVELSVTGHDWTFAPTLAVPQNDRWGRTYEGFSEDPRITKSYAGKIVAGLQGELGNDGWMSTGKVISSAKHFVGDGATQDGIDQGNAVISEAALRDIHNLGYITAIEAGAQSVMASFSSWNGVPMHGNKTLLTDVLKEQMGFQGFVVGDWNGHALIPGCTATDCPQSLNAGLDMYMAPESWRGLWESTMGHVKSGVISMERLDDAVRRILRVKIASGVLDGVRPRDRQYSGKEHILGSEKHRKIARQAVRESLVLLKNNNRTLPLNPSRKILVVGDIADSISKASGGWTLNWQGGDHSNSLFPSGESILSGIKSVITAEGGQVTYDAEGTEAHDVDVVIAIYGELPYAEFQGDRDNVDFVPPSFNPSVLKKFKDKGVKVVSVFISGRPLWTNPEINLSDAFVAAWLPGSEGGGIADMLFRTDEAYDFTGRLSYSWPKLATQGLLNSYSPDYDPLFSLGYGLSYSDNQVITELSEESGLSANQSLSRNIVFAQGAINSLWNFTVSGNHVSEADFPISNDKVNLGKADKAVQEDALKVDFKKDAKVSFKTKNIQDFRRESNGGLELVFNIRGNNGEKTVDIGMGCVDNTDCETFLPISLTSNWIEKRLSLRCFANEGLDMARINQIMIMRGQKDQSISLANVHLGEDLDGLLTCE